MSLGLIASRLRPAAAALLQNNGKMTLTRPSVRNAQTLYRAHVYKETPVMHYLGEFMSFFLWYWMLYHCYFEYEHLNPTFVYPDPKKFTDEELGIPPDDEEI